MKLFYVPGTCSVNPHILLREMGADFQLDKVDRNTKKTDSGLDYNQINPKSYVPALDTGNGTLMETHPDRPGLIQILTGESTEAHRIMVTIALCVIVTLAIVATEAVFR